MAKLQEASLVGLLVKSSWYLTFPVVLRPYWARKLTWWDQPSACRGRRRPGGSAEADARTEGLRKG